MLAHTALHNKIANTNVVLLMLTSNTILTEGNVQKEPQGVREHEDTGMAKSVMLNSTQATAVTLKGHNDAQVGKSLMLHTAQTTVIMQAPPEVPTDYKPRLSPEKEEMLFEKLDLCQTADWLELVQTEVKELIKEYSSLFVLDDTDLGKTAVVRDHILLLDYRPF